MTLQQLQHRPLNLLDALDDDCHDELDLPSPADDEDDEYDPDFRGSLIVF